MDFVSSLWVTGLHEYKLKVVHKQGLSWSEVIVEEKERGWQCWGEEITPELAAAVGIAGHNRGGRHAAWISRWSGEGFIGTTVGGGDLSWILVVVGSLLTFKS